MNKQTRRIEIQNLADRHQSIVQQQIQVLREIQGLQFQPTIEMKSRIDQLIQDEIAARAKLDAATIDWDEPVYVTPIR